ncbi:KAP family P-loop NTPase fold protein [Patiriisocius marinus]|uniref:KAP family P-loop NTPase fold protein n=1 Tax=Patiriisocius marinus TaxID=1397112 RepID=UPI00232AD6C9|nr:P-loop NTPase fold protein [Patiriisocius marinus]
MEKLIEDILKTFTRKRCIIAVILVALFLIKNDWIVALINKILLVPKGFSTNYLDWAIFLVSIFITGYLCYKILRKNYKPSYGQLSLSFGLALMLIYFYKKRDENNWEYQRIFKDDIEYVWFIILPLLAFVGIHLLIYFFKKPKLEESLLVEHQLVHDIPIKDIEADDLNYKPVVLNLYNILTNQDSEKSISIGLVGPWGNGKSSVIEMLIEKLNPEKKLKQKIRSIYSRDKMDDYLVIHFLPYLNHSEDDLISEFFRELSSKLQAYNGKLSNLVLAYSKRLVDIYKNNINLNFFDKHISSFEKTSAKEMYDDINERLKETEKKIIVFVDDLDRLNAKEILQVLKLIRNSADFTNVIFLVAMDKAYVVKLLTKKQEIFNARFIDKFFQLEVYLPAIRKDNLRTIFKNLLLQRTVNFSDNFKREIETAINNRRNLFNDYIKNIRDVKRAVNQIVFEYPFTKGSIDLKDFINFIYFKLKFPEHISILNENRSNLLQNPIDNDLFELKEVQGAKKNTEINLFRMSSENYNFDSLNKYEYFKVLFPTEDIQSKNEVDYSDNDKKLLLKTLSFLFGKDNPIENAKSIKKSTNFKMLMEQRIFEEHILDSDYKKLLSLDSKMLKLEVEELFAKKRLPQLLDRIDYSKPQDLEEVKAIIEMLVFVYDKRRIYNQYDSVILKKLALQVDNYLKKKEVNKDDFILILKKSVFENENITLESRLFLLSELWIEHRYNKLWELGEEYVRKNSIANYKRYLDEIKVNGLWEFDDYTFYHIGSNLRKIVPIKEQVIKLTREFWSKNDIELLCAQSTRIEPWSALGFQISDAVSDVYGSRDGFIAYVKKHKDSNKPEIVEFLKVFDLIQRTEFKKIILYTFEKSSLMQLKVQKQRNDPQYKREEYKENKQLMFSTNVYQLNQFQDLIRYKFKQENYAGIEIIRDKEELTIYVMIYKNYSRDEIEGFVTFLLEQITSITTFEKIEFKPKDLWFNKNLLPKNSGYHLKLISEQPNE